MDKQLQVLFNEAVNECDVQKKKAQRPSFEYLSLVECSSLPML